MDGHSRPGQIVICDVESHQFLIGNCQSICASDWFKISLHPSLWSDVCPGRDLMAFDTECRKEGIYIRSGNRQDSNSACAGYNKSILSSYWLHIRVNVIFYFTKANGIYCESVKYCKLKKEHGIPLQSFCLPRFSPNTKQILISGTTVEVWKRNAKKT